MAHRCPAPATQQRGRVFPNGNNVPMVAALDLCDDHAAQVEDLTAFDLPVDVEFAPDVDTAPRVNGVQTGLRFDAGGTPRIVLSLRVSGVEDRQHYVLPPVIAEGLVSLLASTEGAWLIASLTGRP